MYISITFGGERDVRMMEIWRAKIPLKVQIFFCGWHDMIDYKLPSSLRRGIEMALNSTNIVARKKRLITYFSNTLRRW